MFSLQKLLGKEKTFFSLFVSAAIEIKNCADGLHKFLSQPNDPSILESVRSARQKNKQTCEEISSLVFATFVTALEREDIEAIAGILYRMPKPIEKFAHRFKMARQYIPDVDFKPQAEILLRAAGIVVEMFQEFQKGSNLTNMRAHNARLQQAELEADELENRLLEHLYSDRTSSLRVLIVKDLYEILEKGIDRCRDAGNLVTHILLKNS